MSDSNSDFQSALSGLRDRAADLSDHLSSLRWRFAGILVVVLVGAGAWGLSDAGKQSVSAKDSGSYSSHSYSATTDAPSTTEAPAQVVVYAAGAVNAPGLYTVASNARVGDVITASGGLSPQADTDRINLAAKVADGQRVYVPRKGESVPDDGTSGDSSSGVASGPININEASAQELDSLPGVGPSTAAAIVQYRSAHGQFRSVSDLANVKGIGPSKLAQLKDLVTV